MKSDRSAPVAIVGGGFSGTILAAQLARRGIDNILIEGSGRVGKGAAYSTTEPAHLLNVRAEGMSAWADAPDDFAQRFAQQGGDSGDFAERRFFARYLGDILEEAIAGGRTQVVDATAVGASRNGGWKVGLDDGIAIIAQALVLASGNQEPDRLRAFADAGDRFIANPWGEQARAAVRELAASNAPALIVGTGLTMVDLALSLDAAGYEGKVTAVSRRGLIPRAHADAEPAPVELADVPAGDLRALWRWLRRRGAEVGWRAAVDSLRPHSHPLWQSLDLVQQQRFLRHARPWWDVHRHRIAPQVAATITRMIADERLEVIAGRIVSARQSDVGMEVEMRRRGAHGSESLDVAYVFNCTGPLHTMAHTKDPLLRSLLDSGAVRPDQLGIGLEIDDRSRAVPAERLWALGPLTKSRYWEIVAVPDIRVQAAAVAEDIARELG